MVDVAIANEEQLAEIKAWFFKESIRINEEKECFEREKEELERERKRIERENELFEKKVEILKDELYKLAKEKKLLEKEKQQIKYMKEKAMAEQFSHTHVNSYGLFFKGVGNELALRKRYKDLIKIYHPDNLGGDTDTIQRINKEYDVLKRAYCE